VSAGLVLNPALGSSLRSLKLIIIIEKPSLMIKMTQKFVLCLGEGENKDLVVKLKSDNSNENPRTRFLPQE